MSLAPQELENSASKYAPEAIKFDSQGSRGLAIQAYQRAVEVLVKLIQTISRLQTEQNLYAKG